MSLFIQVSRGSSELPIRYLNVAFNMTAGVLRDWCSNVCVYGINQPGLIYYHYFIERLSYNILYIFI